MELKWKIIKRFSRYKVSNFGDIYDLKQLKIINQHLNKDGYKCITLRGDDNIRKSFKVHRLVCSAFIKNVDCKSTVNHVDGVKCNNSINNLEWNTRSENIQHAWDTGLMKNTKSRKDGIRSKLGKRVICVTTGETFSSVGEAAEKTGLQKSNISAVCREKVGFKSAGSINGIKRIWRFYEN